MTPKTDASVADSCCPVWLASALIILVVLVAWHNCFSVPYLFDDEYAVQENGTIRHLSDISQVLSPPGLPTVSGRPIVNLSLAINYALVMERVWGYHLFNVVVHILAALTLFGIVRRTLASTPSLQEHFGRAASILALAITVLWAVHPLQTEAVTYIVQRAESLMGLFYLLTLYCFLRGAGTGRCAWYVLAIISCMLGMGTKEVMVSAPLIALLYDRTFITGSFAKAWQQRRIWYIGLAAGWVWLAHLVWKAGDLAGGRAGFHTPIAWWPYVCTQFWAITHYLWLTIWPHPLILDYGPVLITKAARIMPGIVLVGALLAGTLVGLKRWPMAAFLGFWFFLILAPTTSILPLAGQTVAEHRMYLPLLALLVPGVLIAYRTLGKTALALFGTLAVIWISLTISRNSDYRSPVTIWSQAVSHYPDNARANGNLGYSLAQVGRLDEAIPFLRKAVAIKPDLYEARDNLGTVLALQGRLDEAIAQFLRVLAVKPRDAAVFYNLGNAYAQKNDLDQAITCYQKALEIMPDNANARANLAFVLIRKGQIAEAITHLRRALQIDPDNLVMLNNLAWILATCPDASLRDGGQALKSARRADHLTGGRNPLILKTLAASYAEAGQFAEAMAVCQQALYYASNQPVLAQVLEAQLKRYQSRLPLRSVDSNSVPAR